MQPEANKTTATLRTLGTARSCPNRDSWVAFDAGKVTADQMPVLIDHLEACLSCQETLCDLHNDSLPSPEPFVAQLAHALASQPQTAAFHNEPECDKFRLEALALDESASQSQAKPLLTRLRQYELLEPMGKGGQGMVYLARHTKLRRLVVLKLLRFDRQHDHDAIARFQREAATLGQFEHPNIVHVTDADSAEGYHYLVMKHIDGVDVDRLLRLFGPLSAANAIEIARQVASALLYVHERNYVHRDIKPSNLLVTADGRVMLLDWGLVRLLTPTDEEATETGLLLGTADYMAPEQGLDPHAVTAQADLYSLGCTLFKLLTGRTPFAGSYAGAIDRIRAHLERPIPSVRSYRPDLPAELDQLVTRLLAKKAEERITSASEVLKELDSWQQKNDLALLVALTKGQGTLPPPIRRPPSRRNFALAVLLLCVIGGMLWAVLANPTESQKSDTPAIEPGPEPGPVVNEWYSLLKHTPRSLIPDSSGDYINKFERPRQRLALSGPGLGMWSFGKAEQQSYIFRVNIRQEQWTDGVGVFLGFRQVKTADGRPGRRYQRIWVRQVGLPGKEEFRVVRELVDPPLKGTSSWHANVQSLTSEVIAKPERDQLLEIRSGKRGLLSVRWAGRDLPKLVTHEVNERAKQYGEIGDLGAYTWNAAGVFQNAELLLYGKGEP